MNALLLKKEIRALLPSFIAALVVAFLSGLAAAFASARIGDPGFTPTTGAVSQVLFLLSPMLVIFMALQSFGSEISMGTLPNLLAQPIARTTVWRMKTVLLGSGIFLVWFMWWTLFVINQNHQLDFHKDLRPILVMTICFALAAYSGGLWTVLLIRQVAAAFWFTLLIPAVLTLPILSFVEKWPKLIEPLLVVVLGLYSIAGFIFARWLFLRAQDVQWTGGDISLPEFRRAEKMKSDSSSEAIWRPRTALFFKELQLHQSQFVIAGVLLLLHLTVLVARTFGDFKDSPAIEFVFSGFWALWFVMPLIVGCAAVAEERKLGTLEAQLCLPVRRRTQFWTKFAIAMLFSLTLATLIPLLLEGSRILSEYQSARNDLVFIDFAKPILILFGIAILVSLVSFYTSTLSRNTLQALAPAILGIMVAFFLLIGAYVVEGIFQFPLSRGWLIYLIGVPGMTLVSLALMNWNFKHVVVGWRMWRQNAVVFVSALALVIGTTSAIYHRTWELLMPLEPAHGLPRLNSGGLVKIQISGGAVTVQFLDGKVWAGHFAPTAPDLMTTLSGDWKMKSRFGGGKFIEGTDWSSVSVNHLGMVGIEKNGSLWASENWRTNSKAEESKLVRIGWDNNWKAVSGGYPWPFLLKQDGTLWRLDRESWNQKTPWPGIQQFQLKQLGTNSDWAEIFRTEWRTVFRKNDGQTWISDVTSLDAQRIELDEKTTLFRAEHLDRISSSTRAWSRLSKAGNFQIGVRDDGKLVVSRDFSNRRIQPEEQKIQLGKESDWLGVAGGGETVVTLKSDGSLWRWNFTEDPIQNPKSASAVRLGKHSDWVAITDEFGSLMSLAADGSFWFWRFDSHYFQPWPEGIPPLLSASRKPQKLGNIFDAPFP